MKNIYLWIIKHKKTTIITFFTAAVIFGIISNLVSVNYDIKDYLPSDAQSTTSLEIMENEFDGGIPNARVMINNVTVPEALEYKEMLLECDGVLDVTWLDDAADITVPLSLIDGDIVDTYYKDNSALFVVTIDENLRSEAVEAIRDIIGEENAMTGDAVSTVIATSSTVNEIRIITICAILFVIFVLLITTDSWLEPIPVLLGLGVAIIINSGSNIIFGEISFVTNAAGTILQLAVSLDYSVFLLHRFEECKKTSTDVTSAMIEALNKSWSSILSSGLTTVIGFIALVFMRFGIGPDLGLALAKGVAISLFTTFVFMPPLIIVFDKAVDKTKHKSLLPECKHFASLVYKTMIPLSVIFIIVIAPAFLASGENEFYYGSSHIFGSDTQLGSDTEKIEAVFGKNDTYVILVPRGNIATEQALSDALHELAEVKSIISYVDTVGIEIPAEYLDSDTLSKLESENYSRMVLNLCTDYEGSETFELVEQIKAITSSYYDEYYLTGEGVSTYDLMDTITADTIKVNLIAILAVFVVLLLTLHSVTLPIILVLCIESAIWINTGIPYFTGTVVFYIAYLIISSVQLGATVDYAILFTDRYREFRQSMPKKQAISSTVSSVMISICTSASVMAAVGFLLGLISTHGILSQLGIFVGRGALISLGIVIFVLPGYLYIFDGLVCRNKTKKFKIIKRR